MKDKFYPTLVFCLNNTNGVNSNCGNQKIIANHRQIRLFVVALLMISLFISGQYAWAANRYCVASGNWNSTSIWSATSGGPSGASVPGNADNVFIEGSRTVTLNTTGSCVNLSIAAYSVFNVGGFNLSILGSTTISGTINFTSTSGNKSFTGDVLVNAGGIWANTANESITFGGSLLNNGTFTTSGTTGTYTFTGSAKTFGGSNGLIIPRITINGSVTNTGTLTVSTALQGIGSLTNGASAVINIGSTTAAISSLIANTTVNTVVYNRAGSQTIKAVKYSNLTLSGSGTKNLPTRTNSISGDLILSGTVSSTATTGISLGGSVIIGSGTTFSSGNYTHTVAGNLSNSGTFNNNGGTINLAGNLTNSGTFNRNTGRIVFNGSTAQSILGASAITFYNLTLNNSNGLSLNNSTNTSVAATLTLTSGILITNANTLILTSTGSVARTSGYVSGNLQKNFTTGNSVTRTFETGTASGYSPVTIVITRVTTAGNLIVKATAGDHPSIATSTLNPARSLNRYWTLTNSGIVTNAAGYRATFTFIPADVDAGANTAAFSAGRYAASAWTLPTVGTRTATTLQATVPLASTFGDFAIGNTKPTATSTILTSSAGTTCPGSPITLTATVSSGGAAVASEGTVTFKEGATTLGTSAALNAGGQGSIVISSLTSGTHSITAEYNATANFAGSTSTAINQVITTQWIGGTTGNWETATNWCGGVPTASTDVVIPTGTTVHITSSPASPAVCHNLLINSGAVLTIDAAKAFSVTGLLTNNATQGIVIKSDATGTGSLLDNGISGSGTARVERYLTKYNVVSDGMYHFLSSPVSGQAISPTFSNPPGNFTDDFYKLDEPSYTWISFRNPGNVINPAFETTLTPGRGYLVAYNADVTKSFTGTLNTGNLSTGAGLPAITYTSSLGSSAGWNLLGNPYPSAIDWDNVTASQFTNVGSAVYVYDNATQTYKSYVGGIGSLTGGIIPAMQGFMLKANAASPSFRLENQDRVHSAQSYYKNTQATENVLTLSVNGNIYSDQTSIRFMDGATTDFNEQWDAYKLLGGSAAPNLYSKAGDLRMAVNSLPMSELSGSVPVGLLTTVPGTYTLNAEGLQSFTHATGITLEDKKTGLLQELNNNPAYTFTVSENDEPERFVLHFLDVTALPEARVKNTFAVTRQSGSITVITQAGTLADITISNIVGQPLMHSHTHGNSHTAMDVSTLPDGIYIVSLSNNSFRESQKIVLAR